MSPSDFPSRSGGAPQGRGMGESAGREPPHDLSAEKAVLSAILLDNGVIHSLVTELRDEDFYHPSHQILSGQWSSSRIAISRST